MGKIHIAIAADSNYVIPATVVLQSIFDHNQGADIEIYLLFLEATLKEKEITFLADFVTNRGSNLTPLMITKEQIEGFPETRHGKATLLRLCLPVLLPGLDKILYLDGDIIVNNSLTELFTTAITPYYIAAAKDSAGIYHINYQTAMGIEADHFYFNAGVTLLNLKALREVNLQKQIEAFVEKNYHNIGAPDQDFLNYICQKKTYYIAPKYNMNYALEKDVAAQIWSREEIKEAKYAPVIVHYIGPVKPWSILSTHPKRKLWWKYLKETQFAGFRPQDATLRNRLRKFYLLLTKPIEARFSLKSKQAIGKLIPAALKKRFKKSLLKPI